MQLESHSEPFEEDTRRKNEGGLRKEEQEDKEDEPGPQSDTMSTTPKEQEKEDFEKTTTPSVVECQITRKGFCLSHSDQAEKRIIPSKVWKDRGGGKGFGYVTRRVTKYVCSKKIKTIPKYSDVSEKRKLGCNINLTGIEGASSNGQFESEINLDQDGLVDNKENTGSATGDYNLELSDT